MQGCCSFACLLICFFKTIFCDLKNILRELRHLDMVPCREISKKTWQRQRPSLGPLRRLINGSNMVPVMFRRASVCTPTRKLESSKAR